MYIKKIYLNKPHFSYTNTVVSLFEEKKAIEVIMHLQILISNTFFLIWKQSQKTSIALI